MNMYRTMVLVGVVMAGVTMGSAARADSASELLEKGIYTEETAGDLDKAIAIYEKVVAEAKAGHALAAQAQYHIGQCLLKKGKKAEATAAFQKLVSDFPDQKDLVAKARQFVPEGTPLGPVPWVDGEALQLRMRFSTGVELGGLVYTARSAKLDARKIWRVASRTIIGAMLGMSRVDADWDTFRPIDSVFNNNIVGDYAIKYSPTQMIVTSQGPVSKSTKTIDETQLVYDNEQAMDVFRRLPLAPGYKTTVPIIGIGGEKVLLPLDVQGKEMVQVPAGKFECFKVYLGLVNQTFWYATDPHRYLVKFEANVAVAELTAIDQIKPDKLRRYEDKKRGFSLAAPSDWFFYAASGTVVFLDPQMVAVSDLRVVKLADLKPAEQKSLRAWAEAGVAGTVPAKKGLKLKVRPESWKERKVSGLPAMSCIADYTDGKRKMIDYCTCVRDKTLGLTFFALVPQDQFDAYRKQFDPIVDSLKVK
jgi:tetratricopeptide (TPR) repeat protein